MIIYYVNIKMDVQFIIHIVLNSIIVYFKLNRRSTHVLKYNIKTIIKKIMRLKI